MVTKAMHLPAVDQVVWLDISFDAYETLAAATGDTRHARLTYDGVTLEIMSPGSQHERIVSRISALLALLSLEWEMRLESTRSTRFTAASLGGFEADESFYIASAPEIKDWTSVDLAVNPPPNLTIEVDISNRRMDKRELYAQIGVSEFWRYREQTGLEAFALQDGIYRTIEVSLVIPGLPISAIAARLSPDLNSLEVAREWRDWLRANRPQ